MLGDGLNSQKFIDLNAPVQLMLSLPSVLQAKMACRHFCLLINRYIAANKQLNKKRGFETGRECRYLFPQKNSDCSVWAQPGRSQIRKFVLLTMARVGGWD